VTVAVSLPTYSSSTETVPAQVCCQTQQQWALDAAVVAVGHSDAWLSWVVSSTIPGSSPFTLPRGELFPQLGAERRDRQGGDGPGAG
jgi:hypothetical protein